MNAAAQARALAVQAQVLAWRHGWAWPLAVVALLVGIVVYEAVFVPVRSALAAAETGLTQQALALPATQPAPPPSDEQQLRALQAALRSDAEPAVLLRRLSELARAEQVLLAQADYQRQFHPRTGVLQLQVTQPIKAGYPQVRRYIESVLRAMPNASLDQITARRDTVAQSQLEVRLRWSFWLYQPQQAAAPRSVP